MKGCEGRALQVLLQRFGAEGERDASGGAGMEREGARTGRRASTLTPRPRDQSMQTASSARGTVR